jgi:predicted TPR repeat methyltransferase
MAVFDAVDAEAVSWTRRAHAGGWRQSTRPDTLATAAQNFHAAVALHRDGKLREAEELYRAVLEENESDFDCLHNLGLLHAQEGRFVDAVGLLRAGARQDPRSVEVHNNLANVLAILERHDEAVAGFRIAIALKPDFAEAHNNLGNALAVQGRADEAIGHYAQALALRPDYADAHVNLANSLAESGRLEDAAAHYQQAIAISPGNPETHCRFGDVRNRQRKTGEAAACYERALALRPDFAAAWLGLGQVLHQAGRYDDALAAFQKAPDNADTWLGRARSLRRLKRPEDAIGAYRQALAKGGDAEIIRYYLASLGAESTPVAAPRRLVSTVFDRYSDRYDQHVVGALKYQTPDLLFDAVAPRLRSRSLDILDLGCGTGLLGARFRPLARTLTGVDISPGMIEVARQRQIYDDLVCGELIEFLQTQAQDKGQDKAQDKARAFDVVLAADVFGYIGDLSRLFHAVRRGLRGGGLFGFSVEAGEAQDFALRSTLRYAHSAAYLRKLSDHHGFVVETIAPKVLRQEDGNDVLGHLAVLRRA